MLVCVCVSEGRKVAKGGESEWVEGGEGREKKKVGGETGGRVATHSGSGGGNAMRRVTLFLNGSPKNGKVRGSGGGEAAALRGARAAECGAGSRGRGLKLGRGTGSGEVGVRRGGGRPGGGRPWVPEASSPAPGSLALACPWTPQLLWGPAQVSLCSVVLKPRCGSWSTEGSEGVGTVAVT